MNIDAEIFSKVLTHWIQQYIEKIIYHDYVGFTLGMHSWYKICKSINVIHPKNNRG